MGCIDTGSMDIGKYFACFLFFVFLCRPYLYKNPSCWLFIRKICSYTHGGILEPLKTINYTSFFYSCVVADRTLKNIKSRSLQYNALSIRPSLLGFHFCKISICVLGFLNTVPKSIPQIGRIVIPLHSDAFSYI